MKTQLMLTAMVIGLAASLSAAQSEVTAPNPVIKIEEGSSLLVDDFEDENLVSKLGKWESYTDNGDGGESSVKLSVVKSTEEEHSGAVLAVDYTLSKGELSYDPFVGFRVFLDAEGNAVNLSECAMIKYDYRGDAPHSFRIESDIDVRYDYHAVSVAKSSQWNTKVIYWNEFRQAGWGKRADIESVKLHATAFSIQIQATPRTGRLEIDNLRCYNPKKFNVQFMNGTEELQKMVVYEGEIPEFKGMVPEKASDDKFDYFFTGWDPEITEATADVTYKAVFKGSPIFKLAEGDSSLIDDFEDGDGISNWGGKYAFYSDKLDGAGTSEVSFDFVKGEKSKDVKVDYQLGTRVVYAGFYLPVVEEGTRNLNTCKVIKYDYKGSKHIFRVQSAIDVEYDSFQLNVKSSETWKTATIVLNKMFTQYGFIELKDALKVATSIEWRIDGESGDNGSFEIDNIRCANVPTYTVTFLNYNGKLLDTDVVAAGDVPTTPESVLSMTRASTAKYDYTFNDKWNPKFVAATKDTSYVAMWDSTLRKYPVTFADDEGVTLAVNTWDYGTTPKYEGTTPTKRADVENTYKFKGWNTEIVPVTDTTVYRAVFDAVKNKYKVTFVNDVGKDLSSGDHEYGTLVNAITAMIPVPTKVDPKGLVTYEFDGWSPEINNETTVQGNIVYTAMFKTSDNEYTVTFMNGDKVLQTSLVKAGKMPTYGGSAPTKASTAQYTYTWNKDDGWDMPLTEVGKSVTYMAKFDSTLNKYTVTFKDDNGKVLATKKFDYGHYLGYEDAPWVVRDEPEWDEEYWTENYRCSWNGLASVTGDTSYTIQCEYRVVFEFLDAYIDIGGPHKIWSESVDFVAYGVTPDLGTTPTKINTAQYTYAFKGWDKNIVPVGQHTAIYKAVFDSTLNKYYVKFVVEGKTVDSTVYNYGTAAKNIKVPTATKAATAQQVYTFKSWDKTVADVTGNAIYTAVFDSTLNRYYVKFVVEGKTVDSTMYDYGTAAKDVKAPKDTPTKAATAQYTYTFKSWDKTIVDVTAAATYTAKFDSTVNKYLVKFIVDGKTADSTMYAYGTAAKSVKAPTATKKATAQYTYTFKSWDKTIVDVTAAATYTAKFDSTVNKYLVKFIVDGKTADSTMYAYGTAAKNVKAPTATKKATAKYTYTFKSWDKTIVDVTAAATYTAKFDSTVNKYLVKFVVEGKTVDSTMYAYGTAAKNIKTPKAEKKATKDSTYTFDSWSPKLADVTGNATYTAKFTAKKSTAIVGTIHNNFKFGFANNELTVTQPSASMVRVQVFDMSGRMVENFNDYVSGSKIFNLGHLKRGAYQVRIVSKSQTRTARVVVK